jgi:hypothetical protein
VIKRVKFVKKKGTIIVKILNKKELENKNSPWCGVWTRAASGPHKPDGSDLTVPTRWPHLQQ